MRQKDLEYLSRTTKDLGLPLFEGVWEADKLQKILWEKIPADIVLGKNGRKKLTHEQRVGHLFMPPTMMQNPMIDNYLYQSFIATTFATISAKELYSQAQRSGNLLRFNSAEFQNEDKMISIFPDIKKEDMLDCYGVGKHSHLDDICKGIALPLIQGIEDSLFILNKYNLREATAKTDRFMTSHIRKIAEFAQLGQKTSRILNAFGLEIEAGAMKQVMNELVDINQMWRNLRRQRIHRTQNPLLSLHAQLNQLQLRKDDAYDFMGMRGYDIQKTMNLANETNLYIHTLENMKYSEGKSFTFSKLGYILGSTIGEEVKEIEKDFIGALQYFLEENKSVDENKLNNTFSFFLGLENRLTSLGIPQEIAIKLSHRLASNYLGTSGIISSDKTLPESEEEKARSITSSERYSSLLEGPDAALYPQAIYQQLKKITGESPHDFSWRHFIENEDTRSSRGIAPIFYGIKIDKNWSRGYNVFATEHLTMAEIQAKELVNNLYEFKKNNIEGFLRKNVGVCFIGDSTPIGDLINFPNPCSVIEARQYLEGLDPKDPANIFLNAHVAFHEGTHGIQTKWPATRLGFAGDISSYILDLTIREKLQGGLELTEIDPRIRQVLRVGGGKTIREQLVDILDFYCLPLISDTDFSRDAQRYGVHKALIERDIPYENMGETNVKALREMLTPHIIDSNASKLYWKTRTAISSFKDIKAMKEIEKQVKEQTHSSLAVLEHAAEVFGYLATEDLINNTPNLSEAEKKYYSNGVLRTILDRTFLGDKFKEAIPSGQTRPSQYKLSKQGLIHKAFVEAQDYVEIEKKLRAMSYDKINPTIAYENVKELKQRAQEQKIPFRSLLQPYNTARYFIADTYARHVPKVLNWARDVGVKEAFQQMSKMESLNEIDESYAKK